jgi:hypothetical protein
MASPNFLWKLLAYLYLFYYAFIKYIDGEGRFVKLKHVDVILSIFLTISPVSFGVLMIQLANAQELIIYLKLPPDSAPMGILPATDGVIVALYQNRSIANVNFNGTYTLYELPWRIESGFYGPMPWTVTRDDFGNVWFSIKKFTYSPSDSQFYFPAGKVDFLKNEFSFLKSPVIEAGNDIKYVKGYIWVLTETYLLKVSNDSIVSAFKIEGSSSLAFMEEDGDSIWITDVSEGKVFRFNHRSEQVDAVVEGLNRPLGLTVDGQYVYVAENGIGTGRKGTIAKISKKDLALTARIQTAEISYTTNKGTYHVLVDSYGTLWWTDNSAHMGFVSPEGDVYVYDSELLNHFMCQINNKLVFTCSSCCYRKGYIGIIQLPAIFSLTITSSEGGKTKPDAGKHFFGLGKVYVEAFPEEGYTFECWILDNETIIRESRFFLEMEGNHKLEAVFVKLDADINKDGKVDIVDLCFVARRVYRTKGQNINAWYDDLCYLVDFNLDDVIDILDLVKIASMYNLKR